MIFNKMRLATVLYSPLPQSQIPKHPNGSKSPKAQKAQMASQKGKG